MPRTILIHLNVELPDRSPDDDSYHDFEAEANEVADMILSAIEVGSDSDEFRSVMGVSLEHGDTASGLGSPIVCVLAEPI